MLPVISLTRIELTPEEVDQFKTFRQYQDNIVKLLNSRIFDIKSGSAVIHFDGEGNVRIIERHDHLFTS